MDITKLVKSYVKSGEELKKKYAEVKLNRDLRSIQMNEDFQPLIKPLNESIVTNSELIDSLKETIIETTKIKNESDLTFLQKSIINDETTPKKNSSPKDEDITSRSLRFSPTMGYIAYKHLYSDPDKIDIIFGVRSENDSNYIGDSEVKIEDNDIIVKDKIYSGTKGLWELLTSKEPDDYEYTAEDFDNYADIILSTNAYMQNYDKSSKRIRSSSGYKYKNIIRPILIHHKIIKDKTSDKKGAGFQSNTNYKCFKNKLNNNIEYKYWNSINELKERLNLLISERYAGNDDPLIHNEIMNIVEELKEEGII